MRDESGVRLTGKEVTILEILLAGREMYGLEMVERSQGLLARGSIYVLLDRLEEKGMVESWQEDKTPGVSGIRKRLYRVKGEGAKALRAFQKKRAVVLTELARA